MIFRIRSYSNASADWWLIHQNGPTQCCRMHGAGLLAVGEELAAWAESVGLKVEREESPWIVKEADVATMRPSDLPEHLVKLITPCAMCAYAEGVGLTKVEGVNGHIAAYCDPKRRTRQVIVPLDERLDDYAERTAEAVIRLAGFEARPALEVLIHLLVSPTDPL